MRVIAVRTLREFWELPGRQDAEKPLTAWYREAVHATWKSPADVQAHYRSASIVSDRRVVFNIAGNKYRLVVEIHYGASIVFIRFIGDHGEYDHIDVETVWRPRSAPA